MANLFRRFGFKFMVVVGLFLVAIGGFQLFSQSWDKASGTVGDCQKRTERARPGRTSGSVKQVCDVTWQASGTSHTATVTMDEPNVARGEIVGLRVKGETAVLASPVWIGAASAGLGAAVVVVAFVMRRRARKAE